MWLNWGNFSENLSQFCCSSLNFKLDPIIMPINIIYVKIWEKYLMHGWEINFPNFEHGAIIWTKQANGKRIKNKGISKKIIPWFIFANAFASEYHNSESLCWQFELAIN